MKWQMAGILSVALVAFGAIAAQAQVPQQAPAATQTASSAPPSHVAVVDVGYIFKNHNRFKVAMDKMKDEVMAAENTLKTERDRITGMMEQIKSYGVGTPQQSLMPRSTPPGC